MNKKTEKAVKEIPREIRKLTEVVATIGETLIDAKIKKINSGKSTIKKFKENQK